jgi:cysteine desulfurase
MKRAHQIQGSSMREIYFDNAATSPVRPEVVEAMSLFHSEVFGNPSSLHQPGQRAKRALEDARSDVADVIGADPKEIFFTSGGTESNNMALRGVTQAMADRGRHIIASSIEHHSVLNVCHALEKEGFEVTYLPVDRSGIIDLDALRDSIRSDTVLASIMLANNETGTIQPLSQAAAMARERGVFLHTDSCQAVGKMQVNVEDLGVDLLSLTGHKIYGPKGQGALYARRGTKIMPLLQGGHQERLVRPGTENIPGIVGLASAIRLASEALVEESVKVGALRDRLERGVLARVRDVSFNGHRDLRIPSISNMSFPAITGEALLLVLDMHGISVSTGSACNAGSTEPSHVLRAMGLDRDLAQGSLRFSLGRQNTEAEVDKVVGVLSEAVDRLRKINLPAKK